MLIADIFEMDHHNLFTKKNLVTSYGEVCSKWKTEGWSQIGSFMENIIVNLFGMDHHQLIMKNTNQQVISQHCVVLT